VLQLSFGMLPQVLSKAGCRQFLSTPNTFEFTLCCRKNTFQVLAIKTLVKLQYRLKISLESYLSDIQLLHFKLGVQIEVVFGSPQAQILLERCLWMAENELQLRGEKYESRLQFPSSIRRPSSASSICYAKILVQSN
jgi:hypothetical protein